MKAKLILILSMTIPMFANSQNNNASNGQANANAHWKINGNTADTSKYIGTNNSAPLIFKTDQNEKVRITKDGDVGVGVKNPTEKVDIDGNARFRKDIKIDTLDHGNPNNKIMVIDNNGKVRSLERSGLMKGIVEYPCTQLSTNTGPTAGYPVPVWNSVSNSSNYGVIYTGVPCAARVGVNTDNPEATIHVVEEHSNNFILCSDGVENQFKVSSDGFVEARDIRVHLNQIPPDYVFEDAYYLVPIDSVESFVATNGHLPNVPSGDEMTEKPMTVGEMDMKLLEKVEELTLYVIELNNRVKELERENKRLKEENDAAKSDAMNDGSAEDGSGNTVAQDNSEGRDIMIRLLEKIDVLTNTVMELSQRVLELEKENNALKAKISE